MRAGPKGSLTGEPLDLSHLPKDGPKRVEAFISQHLSTPKGVGARKPFKVRPWQRQRQIVQGLFPHPLTGLRPRTGLVSLPRGNGKSTLAAALALYGLFADREESAQVLCVASDLRQAGIVFGAAKRMVELNPELSARCHVYAGDNPKIVVPETDSVLAALPSDPRALQGFDPSLAIVDELHVVSEETWQAMTLASGKRLRSLVLAISTPSDNEQSVMYALVKHGRADGDPAFYFREFAAFDQDHDSDCRHCWSEANPALGDFLAVDAMEAIHKTTREGAFRRYRLGQWLTHADAWLPLGAWEERADPGRVVPDRSRVCLGFNGSASGDSTALVACTVGEPAHVFPVGVWENPGDPRWRVPRSEVDKAVHAAFARFDVVELACDPWGWRSEIESWSLRYPGRVIEWPTNTLHRMGPATDRVYQAVAQKTVTHDGSSVLANHVGNCFAKSTPHGDVVIKGSRFSARKIDAAVAMIAAHERASFHATRRPSRRVVAW
jgi:phage terminase large subunit-like protein